MSKGKMSRQGGIACGGKNKIFALFIPVLFVSLFLMRVDDAKAGYCQEEYNSCYEDEETCLSNFNSCQDPVEDYEYTLDEEYTNPNEDVDCGENGSPIDGECYCDAGYTDDGNGDCTEIDLSEEMCVTDGDCAVALDMGGYKCVEGSCVPDSIVGSECKNDTDCENNYGEGYTCSGWFQKTCELSANSSSPTKSSTKTPTAVGQVTKDTAVKDATTGKVITSKPGDVILSDGSIVDSKGNEVASAGSVPNANSLASGSSSGGSYMLCANGIIGTVCSGGGGTPITTGSNSYSSGGLPSSGLYNSGSVYGLAGQGCGAGFTAIGGVCFPASTGLSTAPISTILSNIFAWIMGLFTTFAIIAFVISGIQYFMAAGSSDMMEVAKRNATYALLGVIIGLSGFIIVKAIASALSGQSYFF